MCRHAMWTLHSILCEPIWKRCRFRFNINEPYICLLEQNFWGCLHALTCVHVTYVRVSVTVAGYAPGGGPGVGRVPVESRGAALTELSNIPVRTVTLLHMVRHFPPWLPCRAVPNSTSSTNPYPANTIKLMYHLECVHTWRNFAR